MKYVFCCYKIFIFTAQKLLTYYKRIKFNNQNINLTYSFMRKSLSRLMMGGLALLSLSSVGYAQTLTQDWKYTEDLPAAGNARWGTGSQGKVWTNDKSVPQLIYWDKDGKHLVTDASGAALGMNGTGVTVDAAGNIIASDAFPGITSSTTYKILPAGGNALQDLTVAIPEGATAGRMDFLGRVNGNIMSESGGAFYIATQNSVNVSKIFVANGAQVVEKSKSFKGSVAGGTDGICQPLDNNPESDNFIAKPDRKQKVFSYYENGEPVLYSDLKANSTAGGDVVVLNGVTYTIEPNQTDYCDGFQIVDRSKNEVVTTHTEEFTTRAATPNQNSLTVEKVDEYTANIYQYVPGQLVAKYTFTLPKPAPALEARNAYAYDIQVAKAADKVTVTYRLNAPAESAKVQIFADGKLAKEVDGTVVASYTDDTKTAVNNLNTVEIPMTDIPKDALVSFKVSVVSATVDVATVAEKTYKFYHPQGVAIDNNPESPYFGRLYVTESMPSGANYHSGTEGQGLYVFDQQLNPVKNAAGTYAFKGGQTFPSKFEDGAGKQSYDPRKVRISKDGRVFLSGQNDKGVALWEVNPDDLNADFTQVIKGTVDAATYEMKTADGAFIAAPNVGMDVRGEGNDLKVLMLSSNKSGIAAYSPTGYRTDEYNLGTAKEWSQAPSNNVAALTGKYTVINTNTSVAYDNEGGIWYLNSRAEATDEQPALVHINAEGVEDYKEGAGYYARYGGGGIAFNKDFTRLAVACSDQTINIYTVTKGEDGVPVLTKEYGFATTIGRNCNDIAWDVADNLYIVGNSGEWFKSFSLPRANGEVVVEAASKYDMKISSDEYPATLYVIGAMTNWNPTDGIQLEKSADGVYKGEITTTAITDNMVFVGELSSDWAVVNANRWGFQDESTTTKINEPNAIVKVADGGAITLGAVGTYKVTVDLKNLTVLFEGEEPKPVYPEALYMIGTINPETPWDVTDGSVKLEKDADKAIYRVKEAVVYPAGEDDLFGYISFTGVLGTASDDWTTVNPNRYGPKVADTVLENETSGEIVKNAESYKIKAGKYDVVINLEEGTIMVSEVGAGVDGVESEVKVIAGRGVIRIEGEVQATSVYNVNGQAVVLGSPEKEFNVSAGIYVVVTDGKTVKVLVK